MSAAIRPFSHLDLSDLPCDLRVIDVRKRYDSFELGPIRLEVPSGSIVGLIGQNGAGKTTLMKGILGTIHLDGGAVELFGQQLSGLTDTQLVALKERVGFVSAVTSYPAGMTAQQVVRTYELAYPSFDRSEFERLASLMGLTPDSRSKKVRDLSRGMGMKLQLACVLATNARLLVMDEPTAGLDPIVREEVLDVVRAWMEPGDRSALVSSHITSDLDRLADYLTLIDDGKVLMSCERDTIGLMGIARLRSAELERVLADGTIVQPRVLRHDLSLDLLVPDRAAFVRAYPDYVCDPATIDDVMVLLVKGEVR